MLRWRFVGLVAVALASAVAWSAWMGWSSGGLAAAWRYAPERAVEQSDQALLSRDPLHAWGRSDAVLEGILISAVWGEPCGPGMKAGCVRPDAQGR